MHQNGRIQRYHGRALQQQWSCWCVSTGARLQFGVQVQDLQCKTASHDNPVKERNKQHIVSYRASLLLLLQALVGLPWSVWLLIFVLFRTSLGHFRKLRKPFYEESRLPNRSQRSKGQAPVLTQDHSGPVCKLSLPRRQCTRQISFSRLAIVKDYQRMTYLRHMDMS